MTDIAKTVVQDANAATDEDSKAVFKVDGKSFPWYISEAGATAQRINDYLYLVRVEIFVMGTFHHADTAEGCEQPIIDGLEFPWRIGQSDITYRANDKGAYVTLEFYAQSLKGVPVIDAQPPSDGKFRDIHGYIMARS